MARLTDCYFKISQSRIPESFVHQDSPRSECAGYARWSLRSCKHSKLRGIGLRDGEAEVLANSIGIRVRLLDIRDNSVD